MYVGALVSGGVVIAIRMGNEVVKRERRMEESGPMTELSGWIRHVRFGLSC